MGDITAGKSGESKHIQSVVKAIKLLEILAGKGRELSLAEISRELGQAKSTVHGLLHTLLYYDFVSQSAITGKYTLGIRLFVIGNKVSDITDVRTVAAPYVAKLSNKVGETVQLAILEQGEVLYIDKSESGKSIYVATKIGSRLPAHCCALGKVLLSELPSDSLRQLITDKGLERKTKNTITDPEKLEKELAAARERGYAFDNEEVMENLRCIAAPIRNHEGKITAAISVSGPIFRLYDTKALEMAEDVVKFGLKISKALGYRP